MSTTSAPVSVPLPPAVAVKITAFFAAGNTGKIILNVKCGQVRSAELGDFVDARAPLDEREDDVPPSEH